MRIPQIAMLAFVLSGCGQSAEPTLQTCGSKPAASSMSALEQSTLNASIERARNSCGANGERCHFTVHTLETEILVFAQLAPLKAGQCNRISGGDWIDKYELNGRFKERLLGM